MKEYIKLLRVKHYIKNLLIFIPMFFGGIIFDKEKVFLAIWAFVAFSIVSSAVYVLNDIKDVDNDCKHSTKKNRPIASGKIRKSSAVVLMLFCLLIAVIISFCIGNLNAAFLLTLYWVLNVAYCMGLKNKPIIDIFILTAGFVIRIFYGGFITGIEISKWLYLVVMAGGLFMGLGKRRNELKQQTDTREVLKYYNASFLDKNMYVCVTLAIVFYSLWTLEMPYQKMSWTIPIFIIIFMRYSLDAEGDSDGDPVEVILHDKGLVGIIIAYAICVFLLLYF